MFTKNDIGKKVIRNDGVIGVIVGWDINDTESLPLKVTFGGDSYWYPITGLGGDAGLYEEDTIIFYKPQVAKIGSPDARKVVAMLAKELQSRKKYLKTLPEMTKHYSSVHGEICGLTNVYLKAKELLGK